MNTKRTKILYLITKGNWGGAQRYVFDLATNLPREYEVVVALGDKGELDTRLRNADVKTILLPSLSRDMSLLKDVGAFREISRLIRDEHPDILHVNSSKAGGMGALLGRLYRVPRIIYTAHGWAFNEDRPRVQKFIIALLHWLTIMLAHKTIAVSSGMKDEMHWPFTKRKMIVIKPGRNAPPLIQKKRARNILAEYCPLLDTGVDDIWVGTIAELHPIKRLETAITAIAHIKKTFPDICYIIIGDGKLYDQFSATIKDLGLQENVFLTGAIPDASSLLAAFDIFLLPSKSESYGYVLLEAGHAHLPVVASHVGGIPDTITHKKSGLLVPPENINALKEALQLLINDVSLRTQLGNELHTTATRRSVYNMTRATRLLYNEMG